MGKIQVPQLINSGPSPLAGPSSFSRLVPELSPLSAVKEFRFSLVSSVQTQLAQAASRTATGFHIFLFLSNYI